MTQPSEDGQPIALLAGASRGLGLALARELGRLGFRLVITARSADDLDRAHALLVSEHVPVVTHVHDVRDREGAHDLIDKVESETGPIDTVIVVAGVLRVGPLPELAEDYDESIDTMLNGPINLVHATLPAMRERRHGRIGVVTSIAGLVPTPHLGPYTAAKFGAVGFAQVLGAELQGSGVTVSTITPGLMRTGGHWNATYTGQPRQEYTWFTLLSALPILSVPAERAARIIVRGTLAGRRKVIFTLPARVLDAGYRASPTAMNAVVATLGRMLLPPPGHQEPLPGYRAATGTRSEAFHRVTAPLRRAVEHLNQQRHPGQETDGPESE